jgi:hypothetical protein
MHGTGHDGAVQRAHLQRSVHVTTAPVDGIVMPIAIAHDDSLSPALTNFIAGDVLAFATSRNITAFRKSS